eukprot:1136765-Pelagomonas_calceolata.AAC.1
MARLLSSRAACPPYSLICGMHGLVLVGAIKVGATKVAAIKVAAIKVGATRVGAIKVGAIKVAAIKVAAIKVAAIKVGAIKVAAIKVGARAETVSNSKRTGQARGDTRRHEEASMLQHSCLAGRAA